MVQPSNRGCLRENQSDDEQGFSRKLRFFAKERHGSQKKWGRADEKFVEKIGTEKSRTIQRVGCAENKRTKKRYQRRSALECFPNTEEWHLFASCQVGGDCLNPDVQAKKRCENNRREKQSGDSFQYTEITPEVVCVNEEYCSGNDRYKQARLKVPSAKGECGKNAEKGRQKRVLPESPKSRPKHPWCPTERTENPAVGVSCYKLRCESKRDCSQQSRDWL